MTYKLWDAARVEKLRQCRNEGMTQLQAGLTLGCTEYAINRAAHMHSIRWQHPTCWTPEMEADCKARFMAGESCSVIAKAFAGIYGVKLSRNAVIGKLHRLKIKRPDGPTIKAPYPIERRRENLTKARAAKPAAQPKPKVAEKPVLVAVSAHNVRLLDLTRKTCRFPVAGEGEGTLFCGDTPQAGACYCTGHFAMAYNKPAKSAKELARSLRRYA